MNRSAAMLNFFDSTKSKITASVRHLLITHPLVERGILYLQSIKINLLEPYLQATYFYDYEAPSVKSFVTTVLEGNESPQEQAIKLFYAVRDGWYYYPYHIYTEKPNLKASHIITRKQGHCIDKAIILISCYRAVGLAARLHLVKVKNHIAVERIVERLGTDELTPHAFVEIFLNDRWIAVTPAFNQSLCQRLGVAPLEFDGQNDCLFQQYSADGARFMEYLADYGVFEDYPYDFVIENLLAHYPNLREVFEKADAEKYPSSL